MHIGFGSQFFSKYVVIRLVKFVVLSSVIKSTVFVWLHASINSSGGCWLRVTIIHGVSFLHRRFCTVFRAPDLESTLSKMKFLHTEYLDLSDEK